MFHPAVVPELERLLEKVGSTLYLQTEVTKHDLVDIYRVMAEARMCIMDSLDRQLVSPRVGEV